MSLCISIMLMYHRLFLYVALQFCQVFSKRQIAYVDVWSNAMPSCMEQQPTYGCHAHPLSKILQYASTKSSTFPIIAYKSVSCPYLVQNSVHLCINSVNSFIRPVYTCSSLVQNTIVYRYEQFVVYIIIVYKSVSIFGPKLCPYMINIVNSFIMPVQVFVMLIPGPPKTLQYMGLNCSTNKTIAYKSVSCPCLLQNSVYLCINNVFSFIIPL